MNLLNNVPLTAYPLTIIEIILNLGLAFTLGLTITGVYRLTNRNQPISSSYVITLVLLTMVIALVMMIIGNSIARAFGLVGALSIIRFRTAVKDNRDIAYVFFAIAAGMAAGVGNYLLSIYGVGFLCLLLLLLDFLHFGRSRSGLYVLRLQMTQTASTNHDLETIFNQYLSDFRQLALKSIRMGQMLEYTYNAKLRDVKKLSEFVTTLSTLEGVERVNMLADDEEPES